MPTSGLRSHPEGIEALFAWYVFIAFLWSKI